MRKAIMLFRDVKQREEEHKKQMQLVEDIKNQIMRQKSIRNDNASLSAEDTSSQKTLNKSKEELQ